MVVSKTKMLLLPSVGESGPWQPVASSRNSLKSNSVAFLVKVCSHESHILYVVCAERLQAICT